MLRGTYFRTGVQTSIKCKQLLAQFDKHIVNNAETKNRKHDVYV